MSDFHSRALTRADTVSIIQGLEIAAVTENDLKNPVPDFIADLYARLLVHLDLHNEEEQGQVDFEALELLDNPDHHVDSVRTLNLYCRVRLLVNMVHCEAHFNLKDRLRPQPQRTELFLSAILNFCLHRDTKMNHLQSIGDDITLLQEQQREWEAKIDELNENIACFEADKEKELPVVQELGAKAMELRQALGKRSTKQALKKMLKHFTSMQSMQEQVSKAKSIEKDYKALKAELSDDEVVDESLSAKLAELHRKAQQLDDQRKLLEQERNLKTEEATKSLGNLKLQAVARRRDLDARKRSVESLLSEADAITTKIDSIKESIAAKVKAVACRRGKVVKQFQRYRVAINLAVR